MEETSIHSEKNGNWGQETLKQLPKSIYQILTFKGRAIRSLSFFILIAFIVPSGHSQKYLSLENPKKFKRVKYLPGDGLFFKVKENEEKKKYAGFLQVVTDSFLVIAREVEIPDPANPHTIIIRDTVKLSKITSIYAFKKGSMSSFLRMYSNNAILGGLFLMAGGGTMAILEGQSPDKTGFMIAGGILVSGVLLKIFIRNQYKLGKKWQLRAMEPVIEGRFIERE